jgi:SAM-dependent methyltransferase
MRSRVFSMIVENARVYDLIQRLAGGREISRQVRALLPLDSVSDSVIIDMGGGTASLRQDLPPTARYVCLDNDPTKVRRAAEKQPSIGVLLADATRAPLADGCADFVLCIAVSHHLTDPQLRWMIQEIERVLKTDGLLLFLDAVWMPGRRLSRVLWRYDRGSYPRTAEALTLLLQQRFGVAHQQHLRLYHEYLLFSGRRETSKLRSSSKAKLIE